MKQKSLIEAHNHAIIRLVDISQKRQAKDLDFITRSSINYRDAQFSPFSANENEDEKLSVKVVNKDVVLFRAIDQEKKYSESAIIDRKSGELIHEITRNIKSENSEKHISFYSCRTTEKKV